MPAPADVPHARCPVCRRQVEVFTQSQAAEFLGAKEVVLERLIASGQVHAIEIAQGAVRLCKNSLWRGEKEGGHAQL